MCHAESQATAVAVVHLLDGQGMLLVLLGAAGLCRVGFISGCRVSVLRGLASESFSRVRTWQRTQDHRDPTKKHEFDSLLQRVVLANHTTKLSHASARLSPVESHESPGTL